MANKDQTYQLFNPSGCLTLEAMQLYLNKELSDREMQQINSHLESCELCSDAMEGLNMVENKEKLAEIVGEINENLTRSLAEKSIATKQKVFKLQNRLIYFGAAASIIILLGLLFFLTDLINQDNQTGVAQQVNTEKQMIPPKPRAKNQVVHEEKSNKEVVESDKRALANEFVKESQEVENEKPTQKVEGARPQNSDKGVSPMKIRKSEESPGDRLLVEEILQDEEDKDIPEKSEVLLASTQPTEYYLGEVFIYDEKTEFTEKMDLIQSDLQEAGITKSNAIKESRAKVSGNAMNSEKQSEIPEVLPEKSRESKAEQPGDQHFFLLVDRLPEFPGGNEALVDYLNRNLKYPLEAKRNHIQGTVLVSFVVEEDGSISNARVLHGIGGGCDQAALETINNMPRWNPAMKDGKNVRVLFKLPITFVLR